MARPLKYYMPVCGLGLTQIMGYGTLLYSYAVLLPIMADELGLGLSDVFGLLSIGFFFGGLSAILAGFAVDRIGGRWVMSLGSVASAGGLWGPPPRGWRCDPSPLQARPAAATHTCPV